MLIDPVGPIPSGYDFSTKTSPRDRSEYLLPAFAPALLSLLEALTHTAAQVR